jgi:hypothetical protein
MRRCACLLLLLLPLAPLDAQSAGGWALTFGVSRESFSGASRDTSTVPGLQVDVVPTPRVAFELGLAREIGRWELGLGLGYAPGDIRATTEDLNFDDRTSGVSRFRAALRLGREVARLDAARLLLEGGVGVDYWRADVTGDRTTVAGTLGARLRVPLGSGFALENRALFTLGGSPFKKSALPPEAEVRSLRTWSFGVGLRRVL